MTAPDVDIDVYEIGPSTSAYSIDGYDASYDGYDGDGYDALSDFGELDSPRSRSRSTLTAPTTPRLGDVRVTHLHEQRSRTCHHNVICMMSVLYLVIASFTLTRLKTVASFDLASPTTTTTTTTTTSTNTSFVATGSVVAATATDVTATAMSVVDKIRVAATLRGTIKSMCHTTLSTSISDYCQMQN